MQVSQATTADTTTPRAPPASSYAPTAGVRHAPAGVFRLRPYQIEAIRSIAPWRAETGGRNCIIVLPTGAGKTVVAAELCRLAFGRGRRVLYITHRMELLEQTAAALERHCPGARIGVYSAGLRRKELADIDVCLAGVQSLCRSPAGLVGRFHRVIVDEAHRVPPDVRDPNARGQFAQVVQALGPVTPPCVGLTATDHRLGTGRLWESPAALWDGKSYEAGMEDLVADGYLAPLRTCVEDGIDTAELKISNGEFAAGEQGTQLEERLRTIVANAVETRRAQRRKKALLFTPTIESAETAHHELELLGERAEVVTQNTPRDARRQAVEDLRNGATTWLVSVGVFTEGFDVPDIDLVAVARATTSPGLWVQMAGRGSRIAPGKSDCLVLDYGENGLRHGPVNAVRPRRWRRKDGLSGKKCPECRALCAAHDIDCPACGAPLTCGSGAGAGGGLDAVGKLTATPSKALAMLRKAGIHVVDPADADWIDVNEARTWGDFTRGGYRCVKVELALENAPSHRGTFVCRGPRSRASGSFAALFGTRLPPLDGESPDSERYQQRALSLARERAHLIRRVVLGVDRTESGVWTRVVLAELAP